MLWSTKYYCHRVAKTNPKSKINSPYSWWLLLPIIVAGSLFLPFLTGDRLFIGNFDRLNAHLNYLWIQSQALRHHSVYGWLNNMFLGTNFWAILVNYASPNLEPIILAYFPESWFLWLTTLFSCLFFILAGLTSFLFLRSLRFAPWISAIGCCLYQLSYASMLRIAQNDLTYSVIAMLPAGFLGIRLLFLGRQRLGWLYLFGSMWFMLLFGFLQEVLYALSALSCYTAFLIWRTRQLKAAILALLASFIALIACLPRIYIVAQELKLLVRELPSGSLKTFTEVNSFQNIGSDELFRIFHYGVFGRFFKETASLNNNINITEGIQTHSSTLAALVMLVAIITVWIKKSWVSRRNELPEIRFFAVWTIVILLAITVTPLQKIIYYIFLQQDFTHSRLCITVLLPIVVLIAWFLQQLVENDINRSSLLPLISLGGVVGGGVWLASQLFSKEFSYIHIIGTPNAIPVQVVCQIGLCVLVFCFVMAVVFFCRTFRARCAIFIAGFMLAEAFLNAANQFHNHQVIGGTPFGHSNSFFPSSLSFSFPAKKMRSELAQEIGWPKQNAIFIRAKENLPPFLAPYLCLFYGLPCVDGYSTGVPSNLRSMGWSESSLSLRTITFELEEVPWTQLALLGVRSVFIVDEAFYRGVPMNRKELRKRIQTNPFPALPRVFWAGQIHVEKSAVEAAKVALELVRKVDLAKPESFPAVLSTSKKFPNFVTDQSPIIIQEAGSKKIINVKAANQPRLLVLNERYHPSWKIDEQNGARLYEANGSVQAIMVPPGVTNITLRFNVISMWLLSGLPILLLVLGLLGGFSIRKNLVTPQVCN